MKESARYAKIVEWSRKTSASSEFSGPHLRWVPRSDEKAVFEQLCRVVEEAIALYHRMENLSSANIGPRFCQ